MNWRASARVADYGVHKVAASRVDWHTIREDFPILREQAHGHTLSSRATEAYEQARQRVAEYIGAASAQEIIFTRGTTESVNLVAQTWGEKFVRKGDVILLTVMEHHSNLVPWQLLAERTGARLRFVSVLD